mmetsp:Transcript_48580/g.128485  ORF Transcript_48580/g.128485 Transcript_48580/m.128485 type:complete len:119 (-) Transcript_48580:122-478(-)
MGPQDSRLARSSTSRESRLSRTNKIGRTRFFSSGRTRVRWLLELAQNLVAVLREVSATCSAAGLSSGQPGALRAEMLAATPELIHLAQCAAFSCALLCGLQFSQGTASSNSKMGSKPR